MLWGKMCSSHSNKKSPWKNQEPLYFYIKSERTMKPSNSISNQFLGRSQTLVSLNSNYTISHPVFNPSS